VTLLIMVRKWSRSGYFVQTSIFI